MNDEKNTRPMKTVVQSTRVSVPWLPDDRDETPDQRKARDLAWIMANDTLFRQAYQRIQANPAQSVYLAANGSYRIQHLFGQWLRMAGLQHPGRWAARGNHCRKANHATQP